ncbi:DUF7504 family protein [Natrinema halophilum]|uniref:Uncharacterized protein n=1 Tax=Natrinema halophilum TaxID=1699371 RepID=A0A7D5KB75_9EURY|nr:hypothetical protein [Natrinema halophilum]QLG47596.1 hypothetical protein HYG82_01400 [Natrinema halophilum]
MEDERGGLVSDNATFARTLDTLKQEGSNILLVGADAPEAHQMACQRLLGATDRDSRYRLFVTGGETRVSCGRTDGASDERVRTIDYSNTRLDPDGTGEEESAADGGLPSPGTIGVAIIEAIDELAETAEGFDPAELRVCVDSLVPLLQEHDAETMFRLLHVTTSRTDKARGMGHYHLPIPVDHDAVNLFEPMFDAIVTVRSRDDRSEHQWFLRETETTTDWLEL